MTAELVTRETQETAQFDPLILEQVVKAGNLKGLSWEQQWAFYLEQCRALGLDPVTRPFDFITDKQAGTTVLYLNAGGYAQIRDKRHVDITDIRAEIVGQVYMTYVTGKLPNGRTDMDVGVVPIVYADGKSHSASALASAIKKSVTQGKRRVTQSLCGLKMLDESELADVPHYQPDPARLDTMAANNGVQIAEASPADETPSQTDLDAVMEMLRRLTGLRHSTGKAEMLRWKQETGQSGRVELNGLTPTQLASLRDWTQAQMSSAPASDAGPVADAEFEEIPF